ncbi:hypothetical protein Acsp04_03490 [Actinomadura sp. NBRC 104425]|nr:hypothetical protein Acsp04_03490 [Actinomadura sp. NBRC 104425]
MGPQTATLPVARTPVRSAGPRAVRAARRLRGWKALLLLGWLGQVAVRLWLASGQTMPVATPDETGYLFAARVLTGGPDADLSWSTIYRGGYPLLLMPAYWLADEPVSVYRLCIGINALVSAGMLPLSFVLLRRLGLSRRRAYALAHATALIPAVVFFAEFVLTDAVLPVVLLGWLLLAHSWLTSEGSTARTTLYGAGAGLLAAYAYTTHTRGIIVLLVHVGLVGLVAVLRWRPWRATALGVLPPVAATAAGTMLNGYLLPHMYPHGDNNLEANVVQRLTTVDGWGWMLSLGTGQLWYQIAVTGGLAGVGLVVTAAVAVRRGTPPRLRALALALLALLVGIALATSAALPDEYRVGNYAYGRYLACVVPILFAVGAAFVLRASRRDVLAAAGAAAGLALLTAWIVQWYAGDRLTTYAFNQYDFPEPSFLTWNWNEFRLWPATFAGLALLAAALLAVQVPRYGYLTLAVLFMGLHLAMNVTATRYIARPLVRDYTAMTDLRQIADPREQRTVAIDWSVAWKIRLPQLYWVWWTEVRGFDGLNQAPPTDVELVILAWDKSTSASATWRTAPPGWRVVAKHRTAEGDWVAWQRPSPSAAHK